MRVGDVRDDDRDVPRSGPSSSSERPDWVRNPSWRTAASTRCVRPGATFSGRLSARDTVAGCTAGSAPPRREW